MSDTYDPGEHTVDEVKEYVGENPDQAGAVMASEQAGKNRTTLTEWLEAQQTQAAQQEEGPGVSTEVSPATETEPESATFDLPPTLLEAGLSGVIATTSGQYTTQGGSSFFLTPGQGYAMSPEDAQELIDQGVAKALDDTSAPS